MLNLSLKNGIVFSGIQETEVGTNLLKKRQDEDREDNGHLELMMLLYMQGHHQVKFQFTVKEESHEEMHIQWNLPSVTYKIKMK